MSGIGGVLRLDGAPLQAGDLEGMARALGRRGPDGTQVRVDGHVGLVHARLDVGPGGSATHFHEDPDSGSIAVLDGCLDASGGAAAVLAAYDRWGEDAPEHLHGDFSFAVWDRRARRLLLVRDAMGARPLYVAQTGDLLAFASLPAALLALPGIPARIHEARIADLLVGELEGVDHRSTFHVGIERLPSGHRLVMRDGRATESAWWKLDPDGPLRLPTDTAYVEAFREVLDAAVRCRMREGASVGVLLSGGLDSMTVAGIARKSLRTAGGDTMDLRTVTAVSADATSCPEHDYVRAFVAQGGVSSTLLVPPNVDQFLGAAERAYAGTDDLFDENVRAPASLLYVLARQQGRSALLSGVDGDLIVTRDAEALGLAWRERGPLRAWVEAAGLARFRRAYRTPAWRLFLQHAVGPNLPAPFRRLARRIRRTGRAADVESSVIDPGFAARVRVDERLETMARHTWPFAEGEHPPPWTAHARVVRAPFVAAALERYDRVGAALGVEARHPLLDRRVVDFCVRLPWDQKQRHGWTKFLLRRVARGLVPEAVRWRPAAKHNVSPEYAREVFRLRWPSVLEALPHALERTRDYVDADRVRVHVDRFRARGRSADGWPVWTVVGLADWLDRQAAPPA